MPISMYQASVNVYLRMLGSLSAILGKAASHAEARKIDPAVLLGSRLFPDMFALTRQVQLSADFAKNGAARLAGVEPPKFEDNETTIADLQARIAKTVEYLKTFKPAQIDGSETRDIRFKVGGRDMQYQGLAFLLDFSLPNFYFHVTTAYNVLRHNGVEIGKRDFLGSA